MKKRSYLALTALMAAGVLAGCGNDPGKDNGPVMNKEVTITFSQAFRKESQTLLQNVVSDFKKIEPNITVDLVTNKVDGDYNTIYTQTVADIPVGKYGDLVVCYADHVADYLDYGKAVQLDSYINDPVYGYTQEELDDFVPSFLEEGQKFAYTGTYMMPFSKSTEVMIYNDALIDLDLSDYDDDSDPINGGAALTHEYLNNLTWEELFEKLCPAFDRYNAAHPEAQLLVPYNGDDTFAYVGYDSDSNFFITLCEQYGYGYTSIDDYGNASIDFNNPNVKALMKKFAGYADKHYIATAKVNNNGSFCSDLFKERKCLFTIGSTAGTTINRPTGGDWTAAVCNVPKPAGKDRKVISQGPGLCILDHGDPDKILASWLFYKYLATPKVQANWAVTFGGYVPVVESGYSTEVYLSASSTAGKTEGGESYLKAKNFQYAESVIDYAYTNVAFKGSSEARTQVGGLMTKIITDARGTTTIDDAYLNNAFATVVNAIQNKM